MKNTEFRHPMGLFLAQVVLTVTALLAPTGQAGRAAGVEGQSLATIMPVETLPTQSQVENQLDQLARKGFRVEQQGLWIQAEGRLLAAHQPTLALPAASITKVATTLVALHRLGPTHRFTTQIGATGPIEAGVLQGDLLITGGQDPFFVWEDAIAVGNALNQLGLGRVQGDLRVSGPFFMNFQSDPQTSAELLRAGLAGQTWPSEAEAQFQLMPEGTRRPQVTIAGQVQLLADPLPASRPLVRHRSLPLLEILKRMNQYSNNVMADQIAISLGGAAEVAREAARLSGVPAEEIQLINGSGLGVDNRISPRAACGLFLAVQQQLSPQGLSLGDVFQIVDQDPGVLPPQTFPFGVIAKSGTLSQVSGLAGILPTQERGEICFAILNGSPDLVGARTFQAQMLQTLSTQWGSLTDLPLHLSPRLPNQVRTAQTEIIP